ncbi:MAG: uncharacterized protein JWO28_2350 [Hyphomicrobiales bacterium]|jgi:hypothetical protein|nr:uncharacterized protein [Hyphomicrobiales bacterium]
MKNAFAICISIAALAMGSSSLAPVLAQSGSYDRGDRAERSTREGPTVNQLVDQQDSRIARLKADLRLTPEQADKWGDLQKALHERAVRSAESWVKLRDEIADQRQRAREERRRNRADRDGRSLDRDAAAPAPAPDAGATPAAPPAGNRVATTDKPVAASDAGRVDSARADPDDEIALMRQRADAMTAMAADLRKVADASEPLYRVLDPGQRRVLIRFVSQGGREEEFEGRRGRRG